MNSPLKFHAPGEYKPARPVKPLVAGLIKAGDLVVLYGAAGSGKSALAADLAANLSRGSTWFGMNMFGAATLYLATERASVTDRRLVALSKSGPLAIRIIRGRIDLAGPFETIEALIATVEAVAVDVASPVGLFVIDTLSRAAPSLDENSTAAMAGFVNRLDAITAMTAAAILVLTHENKSTGSLRGSSALLGAADVALRVTRSAKGRALEVVKNSDGEEGQKFHFEIKGIPELETSVVVALDAPSAKPDAARMRLSKSEVAAVAALKSVTNENCHAAISAWREGLYAMMDGGTSAAKRKSFNRALERLKFQGVIEVAGQIVTVTNRDIFEFCHASKTLADGRDKEPAPLKGDRHLVTSSAGLRKGIDNGIKTAAKVVKVKRQAGAKRASPASTEVVL